MEYLFDNAFAKFYWDAAAALGVIEWKQAVKGSDFREPLMAGLQALKERNGKKILNDGSKMPPVPVEDEKWTNEIFFPQLVMAGVKYIAIILPKEDYRRLENKQSVQAMVDSIPFTIAYFESAKDAKKWMANQSV